jgi:hypothetical protein
VGDEGSDFLGWALAAALLLVFAPPLGWMGLRRIRHGMRRRLVNSPRKIVVAAASSGGASSTACIHERSKSRARVDRDGSYTSLCKRCGVRMRRNGPGDWEAVEGAPENLVIAAHQRR